MWAQLWMIPVLVVVLRSPGCSIYSSGTLSLTPKHCDIRPQGSSPPHRVEAFQVDGEVHGQTSTSEQPSWANANPKLDVSTQQPVTDKNSSGEMNSSEQPSWSKANPKLDVSTRQPVTDKNSSDSEPKFVVCYFYGMSIQRSGRAKFVPEDIDPNLCTHIIYTSAVLDSETLTMVPRSPSTEIGQQLYERTVSLKKKNEKLKIMLSIFGSVSSRDEYRRMLSEPQSRRKFVEEAVIFLNKHEFDGLDLSFVFLTNSDPSDKVNLSHLMKELREVFEEQSPPLLLTMSLIPYDFIDDVATLGKYVDFLNVMSYDFDLIWEKTTRHPSEMFGHRDSSNKNQSVVDIIEHYEQQGFPPEKLLMGIPLLGTSFTLTNNSNNRIGASAIGPGKKVYLAYYEICDLIQRDNWTVLRDQAVGPYAFHDDQWVGYNDPISAKDKALFILQKGYGGATVWDLSYDDFAGICGMGKFPVIRELKMLMRSNNSKAKVVIVAPIVGTVAILITIVMVVYLIHRFKRQLRQVPECANERISRAVYYNLGPWTMDVLENSLGPESHDNPALHEYSEVGYADIPDRIQLPLTMPAVENSRKRESDDNPAHHIYNEVRYSALLSTVQLPPIVPKPLHNTL